MKDDEREQFTLLLDKKGSNLVSQKKYPTKKPKDADTWFYLGLIGQVGYAVALPMVVGAFAGQYLDKTMGIYPKATVLGLFFGIVISVVGFVQLIKDIIRKG